MKEGGEGAVGRRRGCLAAILGRAQRVVTVEVVVVDVPATARRRAGTVVLLAVAVVVAVVTGRVLVDATGCGRLVVVVVTGRVWVDVTGRVWVALVTDCVMVVAGAVPTRATGGRLNRFNASSTFIGYVRLESSIS